MAREFDEVSVNRIDRVKFGENLEKIFGQKPDPFCKCGYRHAYCKCVDFLQPQTDVEKLDEAIESIRNEMK